MKWMFNLPRATACVLLLLLASPAPANDFAISPGFVSPNLVWNVSVDGGAAEPNPPLLLIRGETYTFHVTGLAGFHSFYIKTASSIGSANAYAGGGLSANGITTDTPADMPITFTVPMSAPDTLFYNCGFHSSMAGTIKVDGVFRNGFE